MARFRPGGACRASLHSGDLLGRLVVACVIVGAVSQQAVAHASQGTPTTPTSVAGSAGSGVFSNLISMFGNAPPVVQGVAGAAADVTSAAAGGDQIIDVPGPEAGIVHADAHNVLDKPRESNIALSAVETAAAAASPSPSATSTPARGASEAVPVEHIGSTATGSPSTPFPTASHLPAVSNIVAPSALPTVNGSSGTPRASASSAAIAQTHTNDSAGGEAAETVPHSQVKTPALGSLASANSNGTGELVATSEAHGEPPAGAAAGNATVITDAQPVNSSANGSHVMAAVPAPSITAASNASADLLAPTHATGSVNSTASVDVVNASALPDESHALDDIADEDGDDDYEQTVTDEVGGSDIEHADEPHGDEAPEHEATDESSEGAESDDMLVLDRPDVIDVSQGDAPAPQRRVRPVEDVADAGMVHIALPNASAPPTSNSSLPTVVEVHVDAAVGDTVLSRLSSNASQASGVEAAATNLSANSSIARSPVPSPSATIAAHSSNTTSPSTAPVNSTVQTVRPAATDGPTTSVKVSATAAAMNSSANTVPRMTPPADTQTSGTHHLDGAQRGLTQRLQANDASVITLLAAMLAFMTEIVLVAAQIAQAAWAAAAPALIALAPVTAAVESAFASAAHAAGHFGTNPHVVQVAGPVEVAVITVLDGVHSVAVAVGIASETSTVAVDAAVGSLVLTIAAIVAAQCLCPCIGFVCGCSREHARHDVKSPRNLDASPDSAPGLADLGLRRNYSAPAPDGDIAPGLAGMIAGDDSARSPPASPSQQAPPSSAPVFQPFVAEPHKRPPPGMSLNKYPLAAQAPASSDPFRAATSSSPHEASFPAFVVPPLSAPPQHTDTTSSSLPSTHSASLLAASRVYVTSSVASSAVGNDGIDGGAPARFKFVRVGGRLEKVRIDAESAPPSAPPSAPLLPAMADVGGHAFPSWMPAGEAAMGQHHDGPPEQLTGEHVAAAALHSEDAAFEQPLTDNYQVPTSASDTAAAGAPAAVASVGYAGTDVADTHALPPVHSGDDAAAVDAFTAAQEQAVYSGNSELQSVEQYATSTEGLPEGADVDSAGVELQHTAGDHNALQQSAYPPEVLAAIQYYYNNIHVLFPDDFAALQGTADEQTVMSTCWTWAEQLYQQYGAPTQPMEGAAGVAEQEAASSAGEYAGYIAGGDPAMYEHSGETALDASPPTEFASAPEFQHAYGDLHSAGDAGALAAADAAPAQSGPPSARSDGSVVVSQESAAAFFAPNVSA